ncbi:serine/threonine-protein kinase [Streptomyces sp. NPDC020996]|uniref:serine/threonine-protein kinase n=1 Tax=Streptomyces sp. NPDC020996 TaxID=3154791 RepID=UPI00340217EF
MSQQRPAPDPAADEAAVLRQAGASPLRAGDPDGIGPYVPLALLGSGGMGRVFLARPADGSPVLAAVKVIRPEYADDPGFRRRFEREAAVHHRVRTPHTPRLCGTGSGDELLWMATEYVPGLDLAAAVREGGALETAAVWRLVADVGQALAALAAAEIVHRDLKPSNVLLSPWGAYVIDFGLSKAVDSSALTGTGNRVGTPAYMSPEHLRTGRCDTASDVFSLAGTLAYAATGRAPFGDGTGVDVMHRVAFEEPDQDLLDEVRARDADLASLLSVCLVKEPGLRPAPHELIEAAEEHIRTSSVWPESLESRVLARHRAYEVLRRLPAGRPARPEPPKARAGAVDPRAGTAEAGPGAAEAPAPPPAEARSRARRKPAPAVAAGLALCAAAGAFVIAHHHQAPATATAPWTRATAGAGGGSGGSGLLPLPGGSGRAPGMSGKSAGGAALARDAGRPRASGSVTATRANAAPAAETSAAGTPSPGGSPTVSPSGSANAPEPSECTYYSGSGRTRRGDSGRRVLEVQCLLAEHGYTGAGSDAEGEFGAGTESAVRGFQSDQGLQPDGEVGRETWAALRGTG